MKKYVLAAAVSLASMAPVAQADTLLGLYVGAEGWQAEPEGSFGSKGNAQQDFKFEDETLTSYYVALEHPIPLIPNVKLRYTEMDVTGDTTLVDGFEFQDVNFGAGTNLYTETDLTHIDYVLYYEIFDNDTLSIDLGLSAKQFDGDFYIIDTMNGENPSSGAMVRTDFSGFVPLAYGRAQVGLPFTGLSVFAEGSMFALDDSSVHDYQVGVEWEVIDNLAVDVAVRAGYRSMLIELDDIDDINTDIDVSGPFAGVQVHF
ncbi:TIGR04219 family outer membrane beta-barrel protein [Pseudoalteromonas sp. YIC-827]|uniref:TIGR04219 family outer membrane beta-barrel protein n=1 Tax=Pseudoalteromonas qingdaonensis TaxID=3131913 RepID=A0ABU9MVE7_9GAMM